MVFFFESSEGYTLYMGKDKFENEDLIRYGLPEDVWFHVDNLSSAHVYLRQNKGQKLDDITDTLIEECCALVKANSIEGCKLAKVDVVYTKWRNLKKTQGMEVGQVGFHDSAKVRKHRIEKNNAVVNALNRTKREEHPDLEAIQNERLAEHRAELKEKKRKEEQLQKEEKRKREEEKQLRSFSSLMTEENMLSNTEVKASVDNSAAEEFEDDFM